MGLANRMLLLVAAGVAIGGPALAQIAPDPAVGLTAPEPDVQGATADRVARIAQCQGHKFDTLVLIDPARNRSTRVKLCADPGASNADWVKTLEAAILQIEDRDMPDAAKDKVIAELRQEIAKFGGAPKPGVESASKSAPASAFVGNLGNLGTLEAPAERFETSIVPPLPTPLPRKTVGSAATSSAPQVPAIRFRIKCLARGETGAGSSCDFFETGTVLALSAVDGMEKGATLRFRRKGEARAEVAIAPLAAGKAVKVRLPSDLCRGVAFTRIELEMLAPGKAGVVAGRAGPYEMRC